MNPRIQHLLNHPFEVNSTDVPLLQDEIEKYPYFSTLRTLLLFGLKEFDHSSYQDELKKTSIYSPSRVALYHYLQKERQESLEVVTEVEIKNSTERKDDYVFESYRKSIEAEQSVQNNSKETVIQEFETLSPEEVDFEELTDAEEIELSENQEISSNTPSELTFSEWLKQTQKNQKSEEKSPTEKDIKFQLIDEFIEKSPKISPLSKTLDPAPVFKTDTQTDYPDLMTETLAQIYTEQKMYDKAIKAYKILCLKYPEKSEYFEDKIEFILEQRNS